MANVLFITETYLKSQTAIYNSVDVKDLLPHIVKAQDINVVNILGSELFNELKTAVTEDTLTANQNELLGFLRPMIAHYTVYHAYPFVQTKFTAKGLVQKNGENSNTIDLKVMQYLRDEVKNTAEYYAQRVIDYLKDTDNVDKFPTYHNATKPVLPTSGGGYQSGMYIPN